MTATSPPRQRKSPSSSSPQTFQTSSDTLPSHLVKKLRPVSSSSVKNDSPLKRERVVSSPNISTEEEGGDDEDSDREENDDINIQDEENDDDEESDDAGNNNDDNEDNGDDGDDDRNDEPPSSPSLGPPISSSSYEPHDDSDVGQVEVILSTSLPSDMYHINPDVLGGALLLPRSITRQGISEVINQLLSLSPPVAFDCLISLPPGVAGVGSHEVYLRTSLNSFMKRHGLTAESPLPLRYTLGRGGVETVNMGEGRDWVVGISSCNILNNGINNMTKRRELISTVGCDGTYSVYESLFSSNSSLDELSVPTCRELINSTLVTPDPSIAATSISTSRVNSESGVAVVITSATGQAQFGYMYNKNNFSDPQITKVAKGKSSFGSLESSAISSDESFAATGGGDGNIYIWDMELPFSKIRDHDSNLGGAGADDNKNNVLGSPNSKKKKRSRADGDIYIHPKEEMRPRAVMGGHTGTITSIALPSPLSLSPFSLLSASLDRSVKVWDVPSQAAVVSFPIAEAPTSVTSSPSGTSFATSHTDGIIRIWDIRDSSLSPALSHSPVTSLSRVGSPKICHMHRRLVSQVSWSPSCAFSLSSVSHDGKLKLIDIRSPTAALQTVSFPEAKLLCVDWIDESHVVSGGSDKVVRIHRMT